MGRVRLRLARFGGRNRPFYRIVAVDSRRPRDGMPLEYVGTYDPLPSQKDGIKEVRMKVDRIKYWLSVGAQPSDVVSFLFWKAGIMPAPPITPQTKKKIPRAQREFSTTASAELGSTNSIERRLQGMGTGSQNSRATFTMAGVQFTVGSIAQPRQQQMFVGRA
eukprot:gb/GECG01001541.1/.p1 GENE.gb/GECG01001541.1/~~gb/GECG01001541.1/.p1  ORF type:complete len:163 (+),score=9.79 gb/GECG01001541.1/:1-489(+)